MFHRTAAPPPGQLTFGPSKPVGLRPQPLYHTGFPVKGKIFHFKDDSKSLSDAIYKYSTYVNHAKITDTNRDEDKAYTSGEGEGPDYSVTVEGRGSYKQADGLSRYRESDEDRYRESVGDGPDHAGEQNDDYSAEKRIKPLPFSKLFFKKQHAYVPVRAGVSDHYHNSYGGGSYSDAPSGFDDKNGGKVVPVLARFYKQPLPVIQTQLPIDNVGGLYFQYYPIYRSDHEKQEFSNHFENFAEERSGVGNLEASESEWKPVDVTPEVKSPVGTQSEGTSKGT